MRALMLRKDTGASAVEFALISPLIFLLIFLLVDFARLGYVQLNINSAVREGVRASSFGLTSSEIIAVTNSAAGNAAKVATNSSLATLQVTQEKSCAESTTLGRTTKVLVSTIFNWVTPVELVTRSLGSQSSKIGSAFTLSATGVMVCAG